jgi:hypothetical protein
MTKIDIVVLLSFVLHCTYIMHCDEPPLLLAYSVVLKLVHQSEHVFQVTQEINFTITDLWISLVHMDQ